MGCYIWYSKEGPGRAAVPPSPLLAVPNVTAHTSTASVPTSCYSMWQQCNGTFSTIAISIYTLEEKAFIRLCSARYSGRCTDTGSPRHSVCLYKTVAPRPVAVAVVVSPPRLDSRSPPSSVLFSLLLVRLLTGPDVSDTSTSAARLTLTQTLTQNEGIYKCGHYWPLIASWGYPVLADYDLESI